MQHNSSDITMRLIQKDDVNLFKIIRLKALLDSPQSFGQKYNDEVNKPLDYWQDLVNKITPNGKNRAFFICKKKEPVGLIIIFVKEKRRGSLGGLWIDPHYRKQGLARRLVEKALDWAKEKKLKVISLWNVDGNEAAKKLYLGYGFRPTRKKRPLESNPEFTISEFEKILSL